MATYKVLQDIEAEDKLIGPLTLRQFIYALITAACLYLCVLSIQRGAGFLVAILLPPAIFTGFFAFPWGRDQSTEVWALAQIRFLFFPRKRLWNQSGIKEVVTITAPKRIEQIYTDGLTQTDVRSRLQALASTIDSRGWAAKESLLGGTALLSGSDRLVNVGSTPRQVPGIGAEPYHDILDPSDNRVAQKFDSLLDANAQARRSQLASQLSNPAPMTAQPHQQAPGADYWFMNQPSLDAGQVAAGDTTFGSQLIQPAAPVIPAGPSLQPVTPLQSAAPVPAYYPPQPAVTMPPAPKTASEPPTPVTPHVNAGILNLAHNNDLSIATIANEAHKDNDSEVVISLR